LQAPDPFPGFAIGMNLIAPLITPDTTLLDMSFSSKKKLFEHAAELFAQTHALKASDIFTSLFERERLGSTALGYGIAIPHGRIKGLKDACGALYRLKVPLEFDAPDNQPVSLCFHPAGAPGCQRAPSADSRRTGAAVRRRRHAHEDAQRRHPVRTDCAAQRLVGLGALPGAWTTQATFQSRPCSATWRNNSDLQWVAGRNGGLRSLSSETIQKPSLALIGHLNFVHPNRVQVLGPAEMDYLRSLSESGLQDAIDHLFSTELAAIVVSNGETVPRCCSTVPIAPKRRCSRRRWRAPS
jgi:mannitol/fructose-specific phosphotransferase system IIA component (Ntr-type)